MRVWVQGVDTNASMSIATRPFPSGPSSTFERLAEYAVGGVRAAAFWTAALLPFALIVGLFVGVVGERPRAVGGALLLNALCAVLGHGHSPN